VGEDTFALPNVTSYARKWVGTGRTAELCFPIPPVVTVHATFTAHGRRLLDLPPLSRSAGIGKDSQAFTSSRVATRLPTSCGPSPCTRLSRAQSTMTTLTPCRRIRGFLRVFPPSYFRSRSHRLKGLPSSQQWTPRDHVGGGYPTTCTCYCRLLSGYGVNQVHPYHPFGS
jgi:hypothetical protein